MSLRTMSLHRLSRHRLSLRKTWNSQRERDRRAVGDYAAQVMSDMRWDRLRTRTARRTIVVALACALALTAIISVTTPGWVLLAIAPAVALWIALRLAVRTIADLPDELIDERQRAVRDRAYRSAFIALSALVVFGTMTIFGWAVFGTDEGSVGLTIGADQAAGLMWCAIGVALSLPSMVIAWNEREV